MLSCYMDSCFEKTLIKTSSHTPIQFTCVQYFLENFLVKALESDYSLGKLLTFMIMAIFRVSKQNHIQPKDSRVIQNRLFPGVKLLLSPIHNPSNLVAPHWVLVNTLKRSSRLFLPLYCLMDCYRIANGLVLNSHENKLFIDFLFSFSFLLSSVV